MGAPEWYWLVEDVREDDPEDGGTPPLDGFPYVVALQGPGFMLRLEGMWHATEKEAEDFIRSFEGAKLRTDADATQEFTQRRVAVLPGVRVSSFMAALGLTTEKVDAISQSYCLDNRCRETGPRHLHAPASGPRGLY